MIAEHDQIALTRPVPEEHLEAGDVGTVIMIHRDGAAYEVEFMNINGETLAIVTLPADAVRPVADREIVHARMVA